MKNKYTYKWKNIEDFVCIKYDQVNDNFDIYKKGCFDKSIKKVRKWVDKTKINETTKKK